MPRTFTSPQLALLNSSAVRHWLRVDVQDSSGAWRNLTTLGGKNWVVGASWGETIDDPVVSGELLLGREHLTDSLAPLMDGSAFNAPGPLVDIARGIRVYSDVTAPTGTPSWRQMVEADSDRCRWGQVPMSVPFRDIGKRLLAPESLFESDRDYSRLDGIPLEQLIQTVLDEQETGETLTVLDPGGVLDWSVRKAPVAAGAATLSVARDWALQIGWEVRYLWHPDNTYKLTLFSPDRAKTVVDYAVGAGLYLVENVEMGDDSIRNAVEVPYLDFATGELRSAIATDATSIATYRRRYMRLPGGGNVDSSVESTLLAQASVADLSLPEVEKVITIDRHFWPVQLGDLISFPGDGRTHDTELKLAVVGYRHEFGSPGTARTTITARGKPAGAYRRWHAMAARPEPLGAPRPLITAVGGEATYPLAGWQSGSYTTDDGSTTAEFTFERGTEWIEYFTAESEDGNFGEFTEGTIQQSAASVLRPVGAEGSRPDFRTRRSVGTTPGFTRRWWVRGRRQGAQSEWATFDIVADDTGSAPPSDTQPSVTNPFLPYSYGVSLTASGRDVLVDWTTTDTVSNTVIYRDGNPVRIMTPATLEKPWRDRSLPIGRPLTYHVEHERNGQRSRKVWGVITLASSTLATPTWEAGYPVSNGGGGSAAGVVFRWGAAGADPLAFKDVEMSDDGGTTWVPAYPPAAITEPGPYGTDFVWTQSTPRTTRFRFRQRRDGYNPSAWSSVAIVTWGGP